MTLAARPFGAVLTAMVTPFHEDGAVDYDAAAALAAHLVEQGNDGLVISGTTGEAPTTHMPEKEKLIRVVREAIGPDVHLVAGAGSNDTAHAVAMAQSAQQAGASAILSVTPYYSKPSQAGMVAHFRAVAEATELPVMLYDIPGRSAIGLADSTYDALAEHPRIVACKDATGDVPRAAERMKRTGLVWYSGDDPLNLDFMRAGAAGIVSVVAHVAARRYVEMISSHDAGDASRAQEISDSLEGLVDAIMGGGLGAVAAKSAVAALGVIPNRVMRLPHVPLDETQFSTLVAALKGAGYPTV